MQTYQSALIGISIYMLLHACEAPKKESPVQRYGYEKIVFEKYEEGCLQNCTGITLSYPKFIHEADTMINGQLIDIIHQELANYSFDAKSHASIDLLAASFIENYLAFRKEFPESKTPWTIEMQVEINYTNRNFISMQMDTYAFTGGAHPNSLRQYLNFDSKGQRINDLSFFINSVPKIADLAERRFRMEKQLSSHQSLSDAGYQFENDEFTLSKNYGFTKSGMVFYYNPYEIAPSAEGPIAITIPFTDLKGIYKHKAL